MTRKINTLIVDSSVLCRELIALALSESDDVNIVGNVPNGKLGLAKLRQEKPDLVILDAVLQDMPVDEFVVQALAELPQLGILMTSLSDEKSAEVVVSALQKGAFDFVLKPDESCVEKNLLALSRRILPKIRSFSIRKYSTIAKKRMFGNETENNGNDKQETVSTPVILAPVPAPAPLPAVKDLPEEVYYKILAIGASTGGPEALSEIIPLFPEKFPMPIVVVLHMPKFFTLSMANALNKKSKMTVREAKDEDILEPGNVYLAEGGMHIIVEKTTRKRVMIRTSDAPPENGCKPSADFLFRSVAEVYKDRAIALILTGMGEDGTDGMRLLHQQGAVTVAQDKDSSLIWGMPGSAVSAGCVDHVVSLKKIPEKIIRLINKND